MTLHYLSSQPPEDLPVLLDLDRDLIAAVNRWRLAQTPPLEPNQAICELLRKSLAVEGAISETKQVPEDPQVAALVNMFRAAQQNP